MGSFRPQLSGKYLYFLPPSHSSLERGAKQAAPLLLWGGGRGLEAGGSVGSASHLVHFLSGHPTMPAPTFNQRECDWVCELTPLQRRETAPSPAKQVNVEQWAFWGRSLICSLFLFHGIDTPAGQHPPACKIPADLTISSCHLPQ